MAQEKSSFGPVGKAWEVTKIYNGSNLVRHFDGVVEGDTLKTLGEYNREHGIETSGMGTDAKDDDRLSKYNIVKLTPTRHLDEVSSPTQMYLITDDKGHDIGTYEITESGPVFHLAPKIKEHNDKIMQRFQGDGKKILEEHYKVDSLKDLSEKLSKGENLALASEEQARDDISTKYEKRKLATGVTQQEDEEEKKALDSIPQDMRGEAVEFAREKDLKVKEILVVDNPKKLADSIDNRNTQIAENGGPVILIKTKSGKALDLDDDVYVLQDGQATQNETNDKALGDYMKEHEDEGHVTGLEPIDNSKLFQDTQKIWDKAQKEIEDEEEAIAQIEFNMENISIDESDNPEFVMEQMEEEIATHQSNIENIAKKRDMDIKEVFSRTSRERTVDDSEQRTIYSDHSHENRIPPMSNN